ncbi:hypothetical protein H8B09_18215 [Paenibacillus sp. PR3]|uniref:Uncharacterized protein n=1 Tax=Paenibacillus terricola TaxID=2763503 RepID=A0ABR8N0B7_9BACL|nr:hypothetical protein [Paenibacillus terricola]MBD3920706.1 hypothetical protein [Paenibacillus terricola]
MTTEIPVNKRVRKKKKMRRWLKWLLIIVVTIIVLVIAALTAGYIYLKSISLDDIKSRHPVETEDNTGSDIKVNEPVKIPKVMEGAVDKAASLVGKDIEGQDALDVAAILLNSGLSLRDIKYLQGNASYDLTTEEKQRIRDLLLEKLTSEEIKLLRSITSKYGKHLVILNPDYPIEWVGERDPEKIKEHEKQWSEMQSGKAAKPQTSGTKQPSTSTESDKPSTEPTKNDSTVLTQQQKEKQKEINAKYDQKLSSLKSTCTAKSNTLLNTILKDLESDSKPSLSKLQAKFLGQLADAEAACDSQFSELQSQAKADYKAAGIPATSMPNWKSEYDKAKVAARSSGIAAIMKKMNGK